MMDTTKRNKLARTIATMLCSSTTLVRHWRGGVDILYPFETRSRHLVSYGTKYKDCIKNYLIEYYGINDKIFTNKVTKEYIKQLNRKRRDFLGL